jgi:hypothetical protein
MLGLAAVGLLSSCGGTPGAGGPEPTEEPRPVVFAPGELVWAERSTVHVGDRTYDVGPQVIRSMDWTPYGLYLEMTHHPGEGPYEVFFFDGETLTAVPDVYSDLITTPDGKLAAWIDRSGPDSPAGPVAQVVVVETATGDEVFVSSEGMGGEKGDDLGDLYEELPPAVVDLTEDRLVWRNADGAQTWVTTDLTTGQTEVSMRKPRMRPTSGVEFWSPDGQYRVDAGNPSRLRVYPQQPAFGHRWQSQGGWLAAHTLLALGRDKYKFDFNDAKPDTTPGYVLACDLDAGTCKTLVTVTGARDVVFPGFDIHY